MAFHTLDSSKMQKRIIILAPILLFTLLFALLFLAGCVKKEGEVSSVQLENAQEIDERAPFQFHCVLTPEVVQEVCGIESNMPLTAIRQDIPKEPFNCIIKSKVDLDDHSSLRLSGSYVVLSGAVRLPIGAIHDFAAFRAEKTRGEYESKRPKDNRDVPGLGDAAFVTTLQPDRRVTRPGEMPTLDNAESMGLYVLKNNLVYQLEFYRATNAWRFDPHDSERVDVCSIEEAGVLMQRMLNQAVTVQGGLRPTTQEFSGCAITPELIEEKCRTNRPDNTPLSSRFMDSVCEIKVKGGSGFPIVEFEEVPNYYVKKQDGQEVHMTLTFDEIARGRERLASAITKHSVMESEVTDMPDLADRAAIREETTLDYGGFDLYFQVGERVGKFSTTNKGCSIEEAKDIVATVLVPYFRGD